MTNQLVFQSDFGLDDGAVSAMYGVAKTVNSRLAIYDVTHSIPPYNIWEASYRLYQTVQYWPKGSVFVSVVDPGVGSDRKSVVALTKKGHYIVTPDNGTLTHLAQTIGLSALREIDETVNRLPQSYESHTFHGRDVYAYTGAKLASGTISFEEVGEELSVHEVILLHTSKATINRNNIEGTVDIKDIRFGNLWTNIHASLFQEAGIIYHDRVEISIAHYDRPIYNQVMTFGRSFADTKRGDPLAYVNSLNHIGIGLNQGSFADAYHIQTGQNWKVTVQKIEH